MSFWLEYSENGQVREFPFNKPTVSVGRDKAADFVLDHPTVSRQHAMIQQTPHGFKLVVLSRGGLTAVNGQQVAGEIEVFDGQQIYFGQLAFTFRSNMAQPAVAQCPVAHAPPASAPASGFASTQWDSAASSVPQAQAPAPAPAPAKPKESFPNPDTGGIRSWDELAQETPDEEDIGGMAATDFQRLQAASKKAAKNSEGSNPVVIVVGVLGIAALLAFYFYPTPQATVNVGPQTAEEIPVIFYKPGDNSCTVPAECKQQALQAYRYGVEVYEKRTVDLGNLYESYKQFDRARMLLSNGEIETPPAELADLESRLETVEKELQREFTSRKLKFINFGKYKMYKEMSDTLNEIYAYFPDKRARDHQWARDREREMRDQGTYPKY